MVAQAAQMHSMNPGLDNAHRDKLAPATSSFIRRNIHVLVEDIGPLGLVSEKAFKRLVNISIRLDTYRDDLPVKNILKLNQI